MVLKSFSKRVEIGVTIVTLSIILLLLSSKFLFPPRSIEAGGLQDINLNLEELNIDPTLFLTQTRNKTDQFKLIDYPIGEKGHNFDVGFLKEAGFMSSHGIEVGTENSKICSIILQFEDPGAREAYHQILGFMSVRERHHCYPYVWNPKWHDVADMLNHFIFAIQHTYPTELPDIGSEASWFYDPLNDFYYVVFYEYSFLVMVGETGSIDKAIKYAKIVENKIQVECEF